MGERLRVRYLLVGGGVSSAQASVGIRELDETGSILIVCSENHPPYDRPPLSKGFLTKDLTPEDVESKDPTFYSEKGIQVLRGVSVASVDAPARRATLADGSLVDYEKLLIATGSSPIRPPIPGIDLEGVTLLRTVDDSIYIKERIAESSAAVMVGAGYIGMEVASQCIAGGMHVTIIDPAPYPWSKFASPETGSFLRSYFEKNGAEVIMGQTVDRIIGSKQAEYVVTSGGTQIPASLVVVGVGIKQNLDLALSAGLKMHEEGVLADAQLRTSDPNIYVAGDIAAFDDRAIGRIWHADHYLNGKWQGKQAGRNMAGAAEEYVRVPYFYSDILDLGMILRGDPVDVKSQRVVGSRDEAHFVELYGRPDGTLAMGLAITRDGGKLDEFADKLEPLIEGKREIAAITPGDLGI